MEKLTYCMMGQDRLFELKKCVERVLPYVDEMVYVDGGSTDGTLEYLKQFDKIKVFIHPWSDNFSKQRNNYLAPVKEGWVVVSDTDELYTEEACQNFRKLVQESDSGNHYNGVRFESQSITVDMDDNPIYVSPGDNYWKLLMFRYEPTLAYVGNPHEVLIGVNWKFLDVPYRYNHVKYIMETPRRGLRNFFVGGGGDNTRPQLWREFRRMMNKYGVKIWHDFDKMLQSGSVPEDVEKWIVENRNSKDSEIREVYLYYYLYLHPDKNPNLDLTDTRANEFLQEGLKRKERLALQT